MKYLVAVDGSSNAKAAFYTALSLAQRSTDAELFILTVIDEIDTHWQFALPFNMLADEISLESVKKKVSGRAEKLLRTYAKACLENKVKCHLLLGIANDYGDMICRTAKSKNIDMIVLGRRGISTFKRLLVGSNSKYVTENAPCNVLIVKGEWGPSEEHVKIEEINKAEEKERSARIDEMMKHHPELLHMEKEPPKFEETKTGDSITDAIKELPIYRYAISDAMLS